MMGGQLSHLSLGELLHLFGDPDAYRGFDPEALAELTFLAICFYGADSQTFQKEHLVTLYAELASKVDRDERSRMYDATVNEVSRGDVSADAFFPFLCLETDTALVSSAVIDFTMFTPVEGGDPLSSPKIMLRMMPSVANPAGILAGLILLGDRRLAGLIRVARIHLDHDGLGELSRSRSGYLYSTQIDFYLEWMEEIIGDVAMESELGFLAAAIANMPGSCFDDCVREVERSFGTPRSPESMKVFRQWTLAEYAEVIIPRLQAIAEQEAEPKIMHLVFEPWLTLTQEAPPEGDGPAGGRRGEDSVGCMFNISSYEQERNLPDIMVRPFTAFLVAGIVNPYGPTLTAIGSSGDPANGRMPVLRVMLNPFAQSVSEIGTVDFSSDSDPILAFRDLHLLGWGSCPTLIFHWNALSGDQAEQVLADWLATFPDAHSVWKSVRDHPNDPWTRVKNDIDRAFANLGSPAPEVPLARHEAFAFAEVMASHDHAIEEFRAWIASWNGAIEHTSPVLASTALPYGKCQTYIEHILSACKMP